MKKGRIRSGRLRGSVKINANIAGSGGKSEGRQYSEEGALGIENPVSELLI